MERRKLLAIIGRISAIGIIGWSTLNSGAISPRSRSSSVDESETESESKFGLEITDFTIPDGSNNEIQITVENAGPVPWDLESIAVTGDRLHQAFDSGEDGLNAVFNHCGRDVARMASVNVPVDSSVSISSEFDVFGFDTNGRTDDSLSSVDEFEQELGGETINVDVTLGATPENIQGETVLHATADLELGGRAELTGADRKYPYYFSEPRIVDFEVDSEANE